ncbi:MAG: winged helix-turn-helix transcriptional regulator [Betaproteobacteria bacterium]|nr:MAG: winged helix-turn-helix transcriptional regulator [Betaproteobacteria bacterium]
MSATRAEHAPRFAALGDATRLAIVAKLAKGAAQSITQLTEGAGVTRQAITKHLRVLEAAGLVRREPIGREMLFLLEPEPLVALQDYLERVSKQWDAALARLKVHVER